MSIAKGLVTALSNDQAVSAINAARVYANTRPQSDHADTAIIFHQISGVKSYTLDLGDNITPSRYQLSVFAESKAILEQLCADIILALNKTTGTLGGQSVELVMHDNTVDLYDEDEKDFGKALDFIIYHQP